MGWWLVACESVALTLWCLRQTRLHKVSSFDHQPRAEGIKVKGDKIKRRIHRRWASRRAGNERPLWRLSQVKLDFSAT